MAEQPSSPSEEVKSANSWEKADLGSSERNEKFLRLMGAKKKEHHGRIVIGDHVTKGHGGSSTEAERMVGELEEQYQQGLEHTLAGKRKHLGLGFHKEAPPSEEEGDAGVKGDASSDVMGPDSEENGKEEAEADAKEAEEEDSKDSKPEERTEGDGKEDDGEEEPSPPKKKKVEESSSEQK